MLPGVKNVSDEARYTQVCLAIGQIKIDIYSGKIQLKPDEYIDTTPKGNFLEEMLSH